MLTAETVIPLSTPRAVMDALLDHMAEHGEVTEADGAWTVAFEIGKASARLRDDAIAFRVEANDETSLSFLQWSVVEHVLEFAPGETPDVAWRGGLAQGAALPYFREMRVVAVTQLTPRMRRLRLAGDDLERFARHGLHVRLLLAPRPDVPVVWPVMAADGRQAWPEGERPVARVYTIRAINVAAGTVEVDFVLHEGGHMPGAQFGLDAKPGDIVGMTGPGGGDLKPAESYLFLGDETALPAIGRMLEELPAGVAARAFIEIADEVERQALARPGVEVTWLPREDRPAGTTTLLADALAAIGPGFWATAPYVWGGCEQGAARAIREHLKREVKLPKGRSLVAAYWKLGEAGDVED